MAAVIQALAGISGGTVILLIALVAWLTFRLWRAQNEREAARVLSSSMTGELVRAKETIERLTADLSSEQHRSDALDDELAKSYKTPDPVGARERVLARWKEKHDASRDRGASALPSSAAAADPGPDDLLNPFAE